MLALSLLVQAALPLPPPTPDVPVGALAAAPPAAAEPPPFSARPSGRRTGTSGPPAPRDTVDLEALGPGRGAVRPVASGEGVEIQTRKLYDPQGDDLACMAIGLLPTIVTFVGVLLAAQNVAPISKGHFVVGKLAPSWVLGLVELALGLAVILRTVLMKGRGVADVVPLFGAIAFADVVLPLAYLRHQEMTS